MDTPDLRDRARDCFVAACNAAPRERGLRLSIALAWLALARQQEIMVGKLNDTVSF